MVAPRRKFSDMNCLRLLKQYKIDQIVNGQRTRKGQEVQLNFQIDMDGLESIKDEIAFCLPLTLCAILEISLKIAVRV